MMNRTVGSGARSTPWAARFAEAVDAVDDDRCPSLLLDAIGSVVESDMAMSVVYQGRARPLHVCDSFPTERARRGLANYIGGTYVVNPFFVAYRQGLGDGVYRMRELARRMRVRRERLRALPAVVTRSEEIGYVTTDWPTGMQEVDLAIRLPGSSCAEFSLSRAAGSGGFADQDLQELRAIAPLVAAVYRRYWSSRRGRMHHASGDTALDAALDRLGNHALSPREREVARLVLRGFGTPAVAEQLGISATTVKTHRKNLYAKLGIATQSELFARLLHGG